MVDRERIEKINAQVRVQSDRFHASVLDLMAEHAGEWCVWYDGPKHFCGDMSEALAWACKHLGYDAGFCISLVEEPRVHDLFSPFRCWPA